MPAAASIRRRSQPIISAGRSSASTIHAPRRSALSCSSLPSCCRSAAGSKEATRRPSRRRRPLNHERAPLGSPVEITYKFVVAPDAHVRRGLPRHGALRRPGRGADVDRRSPSAGADHAVEAGPDGRVHADDVRADLSRTSARRPSSRPVLAEDAEARCRSPATTRAARVQGRARCSCCRRPRTCSWSSRTAGTPPKRRRNNSAVEWQWTKKTATLSFRNPKKDATFYLDVDSPGRELHDAAAGRHADGQSRRHRDAEAGAHPARRR